MIIIIDPVIEEYNLFDVLKKIILQIINTNNPLLESPDVLGVGLMYIYSPIFIPVS